MKTVKAWAILTARGKLAKEYPAWGTAYVIVTYKPRPWRQGEKVIRVKIMETT